ncbi:MAG: signal recognition particle receptor subunit alpha, partial [Oscillospiraceae bacterium]|nr:signal recognition particle receptor subunit alpha [Oscillospiraceae bacterium]
MGIFDKGIQKTKQSFFQRLSRAVVGKSKVDDDTLDAIEEALVASDMGVETTLKIIDNLEDRVERDKYLSFEELVGLLREEIGALLDVDGAEGPVEPFDFSKKPYVVMVVGVNGVGKTTTIGKLASHLKAQGKKVVIGMIHSLAKNKYPKEFCQAFGLVIWDEVHVAAAQSFSQTLSIFAPQYRIGMSATLNRRDGLQDIYKLSIGEKVLAISAHTLLQPNVYILKYKAAKTNYKLNFIQNANFRRA